MSPQKNTISFYVVVMKVEQPPQQSPGNKSIWLDSCHIRMLHKKNQLQMLIVRPSIYPQQSASAAKQNTKSIAIAHQRAQKPALDRKSEVQL
jgi:hypothetical protein